jgi:two-component system, NtrC family, sensor kinase
MTESGESTQLSGGACVALSKGAMHARPTPSSPPGSVRPRRRVGLQASMLLVLALVTALAYWDEERESAAALDDFAAEQSTLASGLAAGLSSHFASLDVVDPASQPVGPTEALTTMSLAVGKIQHPDASLVLLQPPGATDFRSTDGRVFSLGALSAALQANQSSVRLNRGEAAALGLPPRMAYAGFADVDTGALGRWHVVSIATARRERDRAFRAAWRLVLSVAVASGLVLAFGGIALRNQRKELVLQHDVAVMAVQSERDERLARAMRAAVMGTFAMGIAHEVSTPLGVILGRAEQILTRVTADERATHAARVIVEQAERLKVLVRRFLDLARGGSPNFARVDSSSVARGAVALVDHRFGKLGVHLTRDVPSQLPTIQCDRALLEHALVNLLLNACEACKPGSTVDITARSDGQEVAFVVNDDGEGITAEDAARATEPFFTTKPEGTGTGLGLAIASEIVKSHRGTLTIEPRSPRGTRACVEIPVSPDEVRHAT